MNANGVSKKLAGFERERKKDKESERVKMELEVLKNGGKSVLLIVCRRPSIISPVGSEASIRPFLVR